jgi:hypothetical protein
MPEGNSGRLHRLYQVEIFYCIVLEGARSKTGVGAALARLLRDPAGAVDELKTQFSGSSMKTLLRSQIEAGVARLEQRVQTFTRQLGDFVGIEVLNQRGQFAFLRRLVIQHLADFLLELGDDFAFVGRQRRVRIDDNWFRVDLVFFHRRLKSLLVVDLKIDKFSYADPGQMHMYLNYARGHWMKPGENPPVGLILCAERGAAEAHYALDNLPNKILAAEYETILPDEKLIAEELERSRHRLEELRKSGGRV